LLRSSVPEAVERKRDGAGDSDDRDETVPGNGDSNDTSALRKEKINVTSHPINRFVSYHYVPLKLSFQRFLPPGRSPQSSSVEESYDRRKMEALKKNDTWELITLPIRLAAGGYIP
jgi:hypothetical protein